jgi:5-methylcytosine-specific restriction endonuclease McrA
VSGPLQIPDAVRRQVLDRDNDQCVVCGTNWRLELHHVVYRSQGGTHDESNLATLCQDCHRRIHAGRLSIAYLETPTGAWHWFATRH